ncbi:hypothetical protein ACOME3_005677 [Neoechinorhynchus agilis]
MDREMDRKPPENGLNCDLKVFLIDEEKRQPESHCTEVFLVTTVNNEPVIEGNRVKRTRSACTDENSKSIGMEALKIISTDDDEGTRISDEDDRVLLPIAKIRKPSSRTPAEEITVKWIMENFVPSEGSSLRRSVLFDLYREHCLNEGIDCRNQASFGKLIRSTFVNVRTRRLGTRGCSKYHYHGIGISENSALKTRSDLQFEDSYHSRRSRCKLVCKQLKKTDRCSYIEGGAMNIDDEISITKPPLPFSETKEFIECYKKHLKDLTNAITLRQNRQVQNLIETFWEIYRSGTLPSNIEQIWKTTGNDVKAVHVSGLTIDELNTVLNDDRVIMTLHGMEIRTNQAITQILIADPLKFKGIDLENSLMLFIDQMAEWTRAAIAGVPLKFQTMKAEIAYHLSAMVDSRLSTAHLLVRAGVQCSSPTTLSRLRSDFDSVNRSFITASVDFVVEDDPDFIRSMDVNIRLLLNSSQSIGECVENLLRYGSSFVKRHRNDPGEYRRACRAVVNHWNCYSYWLLRYLLITAHESHNFFETLFSGMGNYLQAEMSMKYAVATTLVARNQVDVNFVRIFY